MTRQYHRDAVATRFCRSIADDALAGDPAVDDFLSALGLPLVTRLYDLAEAATPAARAEGAARLRLTLHAVLALCEHCRSLPGVDPDPDTARVVAALHAALGHPMGGQIWTG